MNEIPEELRVFRAQLLDAIDRDLAPRGLRQAVIRRRAFRPGLPTLAAAGVASAAVLIGLTFTATSPPSAYAAAKKAVAATAAVASGTITGEVTTGGSSYTLDTTQWNGSSIEVTPGDRSSLASTQALELVAGTAYVEQADGTWLRYASESGVGPKVGPLFELAHDDVEGNTSGQLLSLATGLTQSIQPDGTTVYTGTIPKLDADPGDGPSDDTILRIITDLRTGDGPAGGGLQLHMTVGPDGFVRQVSLTDQPQGTDASPTTWTVTYGELGSTPPIEPPATSTPTPPVEWSAGQACTTPCGG